MPKNALIILFFLLSFISAKAQYKGGSGDGYAMGEAANVALGFEGINNDNVAIKIYPNPVSANGNIAVILNNKQQDFSEITVYNVQGILVYQSGKFTGKELKINIGAKHFSTGVYMVKISGANGNEIYRKLTVI